MAKPNYFEILEQGVEAWNEWRTYYPEEEINFNGFDFKGDHLPNINLSGAMLIKANLSSVNLTSANLDGAVLIWATFNAANLSWATLRKAALVNAELWGTELDHADLSEAFIGYTRFTDVDLSTVKGLNTVRHTQPSPVSIETIYRSKDKIPSIFLRGCGVPESFITYMHSLTASPLDFYSCFISYSSSDQEFADKIYADLQHRGVRCWFAPEDLKIGDRFRDKIDESIRLHDKLLVVLSENSVSSPWVSDEVEAAIEREHREGRTVLFPIKIDAAVTESGQAWAAAIRRTRHIGDFTRWKDHDSYQKTFERLFRDLKAGA
jgi:uncharacterized protein YjbI with pentapeptide repeats